MSKSVRMLSLILVLVLSLGVFSPAYAYKVSEDVAGTAYEEAAATLGALEIMIGDDQGNFRPGDTVTRAEFSKIAVHLLGLFDVAESSKQISKFPDVSTNHWANGYINVASTHNIVIGDPNGNFRPEDGISYQEAITILVRILGYEKIALNKGGYPTGYLVQGNEIGLTKKATGASEAGCTRGITAQLAYNALTINLMKVTSISDGSLSYEVVDTTLLEEKLNVEKKTGTVTANEITSLTGPSALNKNQIQIDNKDVYYAGSSKAETLIGQNITFYVKEQENGDEVIILARTDANKNTITTIDVNDLAEELKEGDTSIFYTKDEDSAKEELILADDYKVIYNDKFASKLTNPKTGSITLIDSTRDGKYDTVFINEYVTYVVDDISTAGKKIYDKYEKPALDFNTDKNKNLFATIIDKNGNAVKFEDIKEWNVLSVYKNTDYIKAVVSTDYVTGTLSERAPDGSFVGIGGNEYEIADNQKIDAYTLGLEGTFYLDMTGKIAAYDAVIRKDSSYAYLINAATSGSLNKKLDVQLFTDKGEDITVNAASKIKINGKSYSSMTDAYNALVAINNQGKIVAQAVTYELNANGELSEIESATDKKANFPSSFENKMFALNYEGKDLIFKAASNKLNILSDNKVVNSIGINENTTVLIIPEGSTDTEEMEVGNIKTFTDSSSYNVKVYDLSENMTAGLIIVTNIVNAGQLDSSIAVIEKITTTTNDDEEDIHKVYAKVNGETIIISTEDDTVITKDGYTLKAGDVIQYTTNAKNEMEDFTLLFDSSKADTEFKKTYGNDDEMVTLYGKVTKKFSDSVNVSVNGESAGNFSTKNALVLKIDTAKTNNKVSVTDAGELARWEDDAHEERVFIRVYKDVVQEIIIVK